MGEGSVRDAGEKRAEMGYQWGRESGETGSKFRNIVQYFAIEKANRRGNH